MSAVLKPMSISFTGPRNLTKEQELKIYKNFLPQIPQKDWHVGDAEGLDEFIRRAASYYNIALTVYKVQGSQPYHFAQRSKQMINAIANQPDCWLYAFPGKPCPEGCKPSSSPSGKGSGTWLTVAYAKYRGLQIKLFPLCEFEVPDWLKEPTQLSLF